MVTDKYIQQLSDIPTLCKPKEETPDKHYPFDLQVKIVQLMQIDFYKTEMRVIDGGNELWTCQVYNRKNMWLREGAYIRIRGASIQDYYGKTGYERYFGLTLFSNILVLPMPCKLVEDMQFDEETACAQFEVQ